MRVRLIATYSHSQKKRVGREKPFIFFFVVHLRTIWGVVPRAWFSFPTRNSVILLGNRPRRRLKLEWWTGLHLGSRGLFSAFFRALTGQGSILPSLDFWFIVSISVLCFCSCVLRTKSRLPFLSSNHYFRGCFGILAQDFPFNRDFLSPFSSYTVPPFS